MMDELDRYYKEQKIAAMSFGCRHRGLCDSGNGHFVKAKEAFVGSEYVKGTLPRVLFISLDAASVSEEPNDRTWPYIRDQEENHFDHNYHRNKHWRETHAFALEILKDIAQKRDIDLTKVCRYFANVNSAKCKDMNKGTHQGSARLFKNCKEYICNEVEILRPDIIVTQGDRAKESIINCFNPHTEKYKDGAVRYDALDIRGKKVLKFTTIHPCEQSGRFYIQKDEVFPSYYKIANDFIIQSWVPEH